MKLVADAAAFSAAPVAPAFVLIELMKAVSHQVPWRCSDAVSSGSAAWWAVISARFRAATGYTVLEYVKRLRMATARQLLMSGDTPIADIAATVGYTDALYFSRQFSAVNQLSPSQFRARSHAELPPPAKRSTGGSR